MVGGRVVRGGGEKRGRDTLSVSIHELFALIRVVFQSTIQRFAISLLEKCSKCLSTLGLGVCDTSLGFRDIYLIHVSYLSFTFSESDPYEYYWKFRKPTLTVSIRIEI